MVANQSSEVMKGLKTVKKGFYSSGSEKELTLVLLIEEQGRLLGIQYAYDPNSTIKVRCIDPTSVDFARLMQAYKLELNFAKAAKNSKDGKGKTVRSFHSTTSTLFATMNKMVIAHGT